MIYAFKSAEKSLDALCMSSVCSVCISGAATESLRQLPAVGGTTTAADAVTQPPHACAPTAQQLLQHLTHSTTLGYINYSYINIVGLIGFGICNLVIGLTIFAVKEI